MEVEVGIRDLCIGAEEVKGCFYCRTRTGTGPRVGNVLGVDGGQRWELGAAVIAECDHIRGRVEDGKSAEVVADPIRRLEQVAAERVNWPLDVADLGAARGARRDEPVVTRGVHGSAIGELDLYTPLEWDPVAAGLYLLLILPAPDPRVKSRVGHLVHEVDGLGQDDRRVIRYGVALDQPDRFWRGKQVDGVVD